VINESKQLQEQEKEKEESNLLIKTLYYKITISIQHKDKRMLCCRGWVYVL
jgi:hypothetical protein